MSVTFSVDAPRTTIAPGRARYLTHTASLMVVVLDFTDGIAAQPDPPHSHPHEQISYVADGELLFFLGDEPYHLRPGDLIAVPSGVPHTIQLLTPTARLVDTFSPIRSEFLPLGEGS